MPRVHRRTRKRVVVKRAMTCSSCHKEIEVGQEYFTWARKMAYGGIVYFQHVACGAPRPSQLSSRKTVAIDEAQNDASWPTPSIDRPNGWEGETDELDGECEAFVADVKSTVESIAEVAREVGQEYQEAFDNMPEGLNQGDTGQALESVAQELESWADELDSFDPSSDKPDWPDRDEGTSLDDYWVEVEEEFGSWGDEVVSEATDASSDYPEYEG